MDAAMWEAIQGHLSTIERKVDTFQSHHHDLHVELQKCLNELTDLTAQHERNWIFVSWVWRGLAWVVGTAATLAGLWMARAYVLVYLGIP